MGQITDNIELDKIETLAEALEVIKLLLVELAEVHKLRERICELEEEVAVLKKNSSTSSKPPSSDITQAPDRRKQRGKRKGGGQQGHEGTYRELIPAEQVDKVDELHIEHCPDCGKPLSAVKGSEPLIQQTVELATKPVHIVEFRRHGKFCECCQKMHYPKLPEGIIEGQLFGPRLQALIGYLKGNIGASYTELKQFCADVLGISVSRGMLCEVVVRVTEALKTPYEELETALPKQESLNIDETGWKDSGAKYWVWVFCNTTLAYFRITKSRASQVLRDVLGKTFGGAIITDFYSAYIKYANQKQQFCLAHLIRDIKFLTTLPDSESATFGEELLKYFRRIFKLWHRKTNCPPDEFKKKAQRITLRLYNYLTRTSLPKGKARTLQRRLLKHWGNLFRFIADPVNYQPTNNAAERTLRHVVRIRRATQGSRSEMGRTWNARIVSVIETCRKQKRSAWEFIHNSVKAYHFGGSAPSLLRA